MLMKSLYTTRTQPNTWAMGSTCPGVGYALMRMLDFMMFMLQWSSTEDQPRTSIDFSLSKVERDNPLEELCGSER